MAVNMAIAIKNLTYRFEDTNRYTLNALDLTISPGQRLCIAGYRGAGKLTLIKLIAGLLNNFKGSISYDHIPHGNFNLISLRQHIGDYSPQEDIFRSSLLNNIRLGHEEVSFDDVKWAVESVGLTEYIENLPLGYDTPLLPGGRNLPGSIRTRLIIARSVVSRPRLLAMGEFLNKIAPADRQPIIKLLTDRQHPWTLVVVSDDPEMAKACDRVIIMKEGKIIADGDYAAVRGLPEFEHTFRLC